MKAELEKLLAKKDVVVPEFKKGLSYIYFEQMCKNIQAAIVKMQPKVKTECECLILDKEPNIGHKLVECNHCKEMRQLWKCNDEFLDESDNIKANEFRKTVEKCSDKEILELINLTQECAKYVFDKLEKENKIAFEEKIKELENSIKYKKEQFKKIFGKLN